MELTTYKVGKDMKVESIEEPFCFLVGNNGKFLRKHNLIFTATITDPSVEKLVKIEEQGRINLPNLTNTIYNSIVSFFRAIYKRDKAEAMVFMYYNPSENVPEEEMMIAIPPTQTVSGASIDYGTQPESPEGYICFGTAHSHCMMPAFHSGVDEDDQDKMDGIHITFGKIGNDIPETVTKLFVGGVQFDIPETDIMPIRTISDSFPDTWMEAVSNTTLQSFFPNSGTQHGGGSSGAVGNKKDNEKLEDEYSRVLITNFVKGIIGGAKVLELYDPKAQVKIIWDSKMGIIVKSVTYPNHNFQTLPVIEVVAYLNRSKKKNYVVKGMTSWVVNLVLTVKTEDYNIYYDIMKQSTGAFV